MRKRLGTPEARPCHSSLLPPASIFLIRRRRKMSVAAAPVAPRNLSYDTHHYLSIILAKSSPYLASPASLAEQVPGITHVGQLGTLDDVHIYSIPLAQWGEFETAKKMEQLRDVAGVVSVSLQVPTQRKKRVDV